MILDRKLDLHKTMEYITNGRYINKHKANFSSALISLNLINCINQK